MNAYSQSNTLARLSELLITEHDLQPECLTDSATLESLGIDSLGTIELLWLVEEKFGIELPTEPTDGLETLGDIVQFIDTLVEEQHSELPAASIVPANARHT